MADTSTYRVAASSYAWGTEVVMAGEVRPAADAAVVANPAMWGTLDAIVSTGRWVAHPVAIKVT